MLVEAYINTFHGVIFFFPFLKQNYLLKNRVKKGFYNLVSVSVF